MTISWRDVFDWNKGPNWGHISKAARFALKGGYKYLLWNDRVYELSEDYPDVITRDTGLTVKDVV